MTRILPVQGTWGWGRDGGQQWWQAGSPLMTFLEQHGCTVLGGDRPYLWDTDLDGVHWWHRRGKKHTNWEAAGTALYAYLVNPLVTTEYVPVADRNLVAHSHGAQVVAYACQAGLKINKLMTLGSPVRSDMRDVYRAARPNIGAWLHVHSDGGDKMQWLGELFDGHLGVVREQPYADANVFVPGVDHSRLLNDPSVFACWERFNLLSFLTRGFPVDDRAAVPCR